MDKLKAIRTFVQIAADGSLTGAARSLGSSLPAVVRQLAELEASLGVRLFNRTTRRISLTEEGHRYLQSCTDILSSLEEAEASLAADSVEPSGSLLITAPVMFGQIYVAPATTRFVQRYDKVRCQLHLNDRNIDLLENGIDVGIRIGKLPDSSLIARQISTVRRVVVASPEYLAQQGIPKHPKDLLQGNAVRIFSRWQPWTFQEGEKQFTVPVTGNLEFNQISPAIDACLAGMGFGLFMSYQVAPYIQQGLLKVVLENFEQSPRPISVVYPHAQLLPARTRAFIDWIIQELDGVVPVL
ncbi:LysR family transcriptional regulator [Hahella sp. CCB-MM4]|uniref:LysR family transcriptional regulator n=1 Tax=Hahella sp. (strain CCB-MM4) TaxID=1926491 RepID=UPI000B9A5581|nr:LysR family transcriptional regulator [Hahella sp. CCB-MM4]OZG71089.1 LysR family transcriptional regulator [Hahella sp. CCB-MM4]